MESVETGAPWVPIADLSAAVGPSERQIHKFKTQGVLRPGVHFYAVGGGGGQPFYATAGGKNAEGLGKALKMAEQIISN